MRLRAASVVAIVCLWGAVALAGEERGPAWIGYGGPEGTRVYPGNPPTTFDKPKWETPLPVWGHGSPLAVAGKVFVMCEVGPKNVFPMLVCVDGASGKILWQREIDHLPAITRSAQQQQALRKAIRQWFDRESEIINSPTQENQKPPIPGNDRAQNTRLAELYESMGLMHDKFRRGPYCRGYECMGDAFGTPVSDGRAVYVATLWGGFAALDFDGNFKWIAYARGNRWTWCNVGRSPILHGDLLLYNGGGTMRALDRNTGKLRWQHEDPPGAYSIVTPAVVTIRGQDILLAAGPSAYLLPDGRPLKVEGWVSEGMQILVKHDEPDVAFFCGSGEHCGWQNKGDADIQPPAAFRFSLEGDTLKGTLLWHGGDLGGKGVWGGNAPWMVYDQGKFFHRDGAVLDALTGKVRLGAFGRFGRAVPRTRHLLAIAGGHVYGLDNSAMQVYTLDGKMVAENKLVRREPTPEQQAMHKYCTGNPRVWMDGQAPRFSYGHAFTFDGDRIYIRSLEGLICFGK